MHLMYAKSLELYSIQNAPAEYPSILKHCLMAKMNFYARAKKHSCHALFPVQRRTLRSSERRRRYSRASPTFTSSVLSRRQPPSQTTSSGRFTRWLVNRLIDCLGDLRVDGLVDWLIYRLNPLRVEVLDGWLID